MVPYYDARDVARYLPYDACMQAVSDAMRDFSAAGRDQPLRTIITLEPGKMFAQMPGLLEDGAGFGAKVISVFPSPAGQGGTSHQGVVVLFDAGTGAVTCLVDAHEITKRRTAAASAVASRYLARPDARTLGIFGTGTQAEAHIHALQAVLPLVKVMVCGREREKTEDFAAQMAAATGIPVVAEMDGAALAARADIICTVTGAAEPILFGDWIRPGTHINVVGSSYDGPREVDDALVLGSRFYVDSRRSVEVAGSEYLHALRAGLIDESFIIGELGELVAGTVTGRMSDDDITVYKSLGHVVQDLASAAQVHFEASKKER